ncbi:eukaryotic translation initiation factor 3 subunit G domain-containing protein [Ditylenchus destructor]|nr:eukaryotic translation initiation factor 3 subunit G domain-containing protein [Ditylenchus destructor]
MSDFVSDDDFDLCGIDSDHKQVLEEITSSKDVHKEIPRLVAERKKWKKFGASADDDAGPHINTTSVAPEVNMQFLLNRMAQPLVAPIEIAASEPQKPNVGLRCHTCKLTDHRSWECPYKELLRDENKEEEAAKSLKYLPRHLRGDQSNAQMEDTSKEQRTVRISNLPQEEDPNMEEELKELFGKCGKISRVFVSVDKKNCCRGFAYCQYVTEESASLAVQELNGKPFQYLILGVELAE